MKPSVSPEYELLFCCARTVLSERHLSAIATLLERRLDWHRVLELASWHRLSPLLFLSLYRPEFASCIPTAVVQDLQSDYYGSAARNLYLQSELGKVLQALRAEGIPAIVLKGAALAETVYRDAALRPMSDLDILVQERHLDYADSLIKGLGYSNSASPEVQKSTREEHRHYPSLLDPDRFVKFEIHRHIIRADNPLHFDLAGFWVRARPIAIAGAHALIPGPEDLLIHLCINFFLDRHNRSRGALGQVVDISETVLHYKDVLDWDLFAREVHQHNLAGPIYCALLATDKLLETTPPEDVLRNLRPVAFSPDLASRFIDRRVLETGPWLAHQLVNPCLNYTSLNVIKSALSRLFPERYDLAERYELSSSPGWPLGLYARRILQVSQLLGRALLRPQELRQDLQIDRWLHSLYVAELRSQGLLEIHGKEQT